MDLSLATSLFAAHERSADTPARVREHDGHERRRGEDLSLAVDAAYWPRATALRIIIAISYATLIPLGVIPMSRAWWLFSGIGLLVYSIAMFGTYLRWPSATWVHSSLCPYIDTLIVTIAMIAVARPDYPIWVGYMLVISSLSAVQSTRYVLAFSVWTIACYWVGTWVLDASGRAAMSWQLGVGVSLMSMFTALNADVISTSNRRLQRMVLDASMTDPLTGVANRRRFREILDMHRAPGTRPLAVIMYDLDNFKQINETKGHVYADGVLVNVCTELRSCFRDADAVARYGGDELVVLAHVASADDAMIIARRSLDEVRERAGVALSAGVAIYPLNAMTLEGAVQAADRALGRSKREGKARVTLAEERTAA
jgi:diguanylate cyclase (GGDEF)-like protein